MPTYSYACTECDNKFDAVQSFSDDALTDCPKCDGRLRKLFGKVGVVFKGSGFYRTDSRAGAGSTVAKGESSSDSPSSGSDSGSTSSEKKSDAKPKSESKSESKSSTPSKSSPAAAAS